MSDYARYRAWVLARQANLVAKAEGYTSDLRDTNAQNQGRIHTKAA